MTPARWQQVEDVYHAVVAHPEREWAGVMAELCGTDETLRHEVQSLLVHAEAAGAFLEAPPVDEAVAAALDIDAAEPTLVGRWFGAYRVLSLLGAGGMGEVHRARDERLGRDVAIKILPRLLSSDPGRRARFEREARMLAALNHPNIGAIYGHEEVESGLALVLELVEGETLADRLARPRRGRLGALGQPSSGVPLKEALTIARQIAQALEAAHERGIIHRDLKPANIKITPAGVVKVLDFGLAKFRSGNWSETGGDSKEFGDGEDVTVAPDRAIHQTRDGTILGTVRYMSPEQAAGKPADKRSDLWAFGVVLLEMLTGRPAFAGTTDSDVLAAVADAEPDWTLLPAETSAPLRTLLRRCLEKDPPRRLDSATAARLEIDEALTAPAAGPSVRSVVPPHRVALVSTATLAAGAAIAALVAWALTPAPAAPALSSRFAIAPSPGMPLNLSGDERDIALSSDGRSFAYLGGGGLRAGAAVMVRAADQLEARLVAWGGLGLFPSRDGKWIGMFTNTELSKVPIDGGAAVSVTQIVGESRGASWADDNTIVFATDDPATGLLRVSAEGGEPTVLTTPDATQHETDHGFPSVLPGGRAVLFTITAGGQADSRQVAVLDLKTGERKTLIRGGSQAEYVDPWEGSEQFGYLIYAASGALRAVRFDPARLAVLGEPVTVVEGVTTKATGAANYAVSRQGTLFYVSSGAPAQLVPKSLVWVDRSGHEEPINLPPRSYGPPRISPDGMLLAFNIIDQAGADIWIFDFGRETMRRLTFAPGIEGVPLWTPDGQRIIHTSNRTGVPNVYGRASDGTGPEDRLTTSVNAQYATSMAPDGSVLGFENVPIPVAPGAAFRTRLFTQASLGGRRRASVSNVAIRSGVAPSDETLFDGTWPEFSSNGRYVAYQSDESGRAEVYVRPFPRVDSGRWQISLAGGTRPVWSRDGRELFYLDASDALTAVAVRTSGPTFSAGQPAKVFDAKYATPFPPRHYDVSPDGRRFLMLKEAASGVPSANMVVVEHWFEELKARVR